MISTILSFIGLFDKNSKKISYISVAFLSGMLVINIKLLLSGLTIDGYKMSDTSITDWATGVAALSAMRIANKHVNNIQTNKQKQE